MELDKYTVGKRYGKALYELAVEEQQVEVVYEDLESIRKVYAEIPELGELLSDVRLDLREKRQIMDTLVTGYDSLFKNFLEVVYRYNRMSDLLFIIEEFDRRYDEDKGYISGTVTTAVALTDDQKAKLEKQLAVTLGVQEAHLVPQVDAEILGGVIVEANHKVIDGSVRSRLEAIRKRLL